MLISILSTEDGGTAGEDLVKTVSDYITSEDKRPLTDQVTVQSAKLVEYDIDAKIYIFVAPSMTVTEQECRAALDIYIKKHTTIGNLIARSGIFDALHTEGVQKVELLSPQQDISTDKEQAPVCKNINLEFVIINDSD